MTTTTLADTADNREAETRWAVETHGLTKWIRVLLGLTHADSGTMSLLGYPVPKHRDVALARVGAIVDEPRFHGHLTGRQNLQVLAAAREHAARDRIGPALERVGMA